MNPDSFYTYIYYDPSRDNEPIYVGKGKLDRVWEHFKSNFNHPFVNRLKHMKNKSIVPIIGIYAGLDEEFAHLLEIELISKFGRKDLGKGSLLNLTDGGEGCSGRIYFHSQSAKDNISKATKGKKVSAEWLIKQRSRTHHKATTDEMSKSQCNRWENIRNNNISYKTKPFHKIKGPSKIFETVHEAANFYNTSISTIYRWCDKNKPVKSRPGWSIIKEN